VLKIPGSNIEVVKGTKSREKTIEIAEIDVKGNEEEFIATLRRRLQNAVD